MFNLIVCTDKNHGIGKNGKLLFSLEEDMRFFKEMTTGKVVVMGRKTLESMPNGQPLKNRTNIVLTRDKTLTRDDVIVCHSIDDLLKKLREYKNDDVFVIGGGQIYRALLPCCNRAYITLVDTKKDADTFFPDIADDSEWRLETSSETCTESGIDFKFLTYIKTT